MIFIYIPKIYHWNKKLFRLAWLWVMHSGYLECPERENKEG